MIGALMVIRPREQAAPEPWEMGALEVELEEEMSREAAGLSDAEESLEIDDGSTPGFGSVPLPPGLVVDEDAEAPAASEEVVDELLSDDSEDADLEDLDDMADDLDFDDLDDMAEDLNEADEDVDASFLDDML